MKNRRVDYQELELAIDSDSNKQKPTNLLAGIARFWHWLIESTIVVRLNIAY